MRVAVCLSGQPRAFEFCADNIRECFNVPGLGVSYHIHAWTRDTSPLGSKTETVKVYRKEELTEKLKSLFQPKYLCVESVSEVPELVGTVPPTEQLYSLSKSLGSLKDCSYDWVFYSRMDWLRYTYYLDGRAVQERVHLDKIENAPKASREIYVNYAGEEIWKGEDGGNLRIMNDWGFSCNWKTALIWSQIYSDYRKLRSVLVSNSDWKHCLAVEPFWSLFAHLHQIQILPGHEILCPGKPFRTRILEICPDFNLKEKKYVDFFRKFDWYNFKKAGSYDLYGISKVGVLV